MKITSSQFRQDNNILFRANIDMFTDNDIFEQGGSYPVWTSDRFIDSNQNGQMDIEVDKKLFKTITSLKDPVPAGEFRGLMKSKEKPDGTEVLTMDNYRELFVEDQTCVSGNLTGKSQLSTSNRRSLTQLTREIVPGNPESKWAIDFKRNEFLIFEPK